MSLRGACHVWERNWMVYRRRWIYSMLPNFFEPVFYLLGIGLGLGAYVAEGGEFDGGYLAFLAPGLVAVAAMNGASFETTYNVFVKLHFAKLYDAMVATRMSMEDVALGEIMWATTRSFAYGSGFLIVSLLFGVPVTPWLLLAPFAIVLIGFCFAALGLAFTSLIPMIELYSYYFTLLVTPLFMFSGVFFPLEDRFSPALLTVAKLTPLYHGVELMRGLSRGRPDDLLLHAAYLATLGSLLTAFAIRRIRRKVIV